MPTQPDWIAYHTALHMMSRAEVRALRNEQLKLEKTLEPGTKRECLERRMLMVKSHLYDHEGEPEE